MGIRYFFAKSGEYLGAFEGDDALETLPNGAVEFPHAPNDGRDRLVNGLLVPFQPPIDPLIVVTSAVKSLPVALRTDADFGTFVNQCLLAIEHQDMESLGYLLNNSITTTPDPSYKGFRTTEPAYVQLFTSAKQLFNV